MGVGVGAGVEREWDRVERGKGERFYHPFICICLSTRYCQYAMKFHKCIHVRRYY